MGNKFIKNIIFSDKPLNMWYRYKDIFQVIPAPDKAKKPPVIIGHYPLILELSYESDLRPKRGDLFWYRDVWEHEYFEELKKKSNEDQLNELLQKSGLWTESYRKSAIVDELNYLLTLFTNHTFFLYRTKNPEFSWFAPMEKEFEDIKESLWGQQWYSIDGFDKKISEFSIPVTKKADMIPIEKYYNPLNRAYFAGSDNQIQFPDRLDELFDRYFSMEQDKKKVFFTSCYLYCKARELKNICGSLALIALVSAIETIMNYGVKSKEKCNECGAPRLQITKRFKDFIIEYGSPNLKKIAGLLYKFRSKISHNGNLLSEDLYDIGFFVGDINKHELLVESAPEVTQVVILNWLLRQETE